MFAAIRVVPVIAAVSMVTLFVALSLRVGPGTSTGPGATAAPSSGPAIAWDSGLVRLTASTMRIHADDKTFTGEAEDVAVWSDLGDGANRTLEATWTEQDVEQRLYLYFAADDADWWVSELRTYYGSPCEPDWIRYPGPLFKTPLGQAFRGDVRLTGGLGRLRDSVQVTGSLEFDDLTIEVIEVDAVPPTAPPPVAEPVNPVPSATPSGETLCDPRPVPSADLGPASWWLDPDHAPPDSDSVALHILVLERECASGASADGRIAEPVVDYGTDAVTITIGVHRRDGDQECQGNPSTPFIVKLTEPLGGRVLLDGGHAQPVIPSPPEP